MKVLKLNLLLINIPFRFTIYVIVETSFNAKKNKDGLTKSIFHELLIIIMYENWFYMVETITKRLML